MSRRLAILCVALLAVTPPAALADYYYYAVAADDFLDDNDTLWAALEPYPEWHVDNAVLRDNWDADDGDRTDGRDSVYDDLQWYSNNLSDGDVFVFAYMGHGGWEGGDSYFPDEGSTPQPSENDPTPANDPPYELDEFFGYTGSTMYMWDDDLRETLVDMDPGVEVIVISGACHSGGWIGGSHDLDTSAPALNNGLYAILAAPEQGTSIAVKQFGDDYYEILLTEALSDTIQPSMTASQWYEAAMDYGETHYYTLKQPWDSSAHPYYYWPDENWTPTAYEASWQTSGDGHWGWQETYLQLRPLSFSTLDAEHDNPLATPEPTTTTLLVLGLLGLGVAHRRPKHDQCVSNGRYATH